MCGSSPAPAPPPAAPPPPPPVLEQLAPETAAAKTGVTQTRRAGGTKEYRNNLGIEAAPTQAGNSGLSINT